jgi:hypothetical protein
MKDSTSDELISIRKELKSIIAEIESIEDGIKADFVGIGNDICVARLQNYLDKRLDPAKDYLYKIEC